jgi:hypothetical protein
MIQAIIQLVKGKNQKKLFFYFPQPPGYIKYFTHISAIYSINLHKTALFSAICIKNTSKTSQGGIGHKEPAG